MKNFGLMLVLFFCSFSSNSFDKFDAEVCEASTDDSARVLCYRNAGFSNKCQNNEPAKELVCYRDIANELEKKFAEQKQKEESETQTINPGTYYVTENVLEERLSPSATGSVTNKIYRQQKIEVFEVKSGWARVSKYYDGAVEGKSGEVARWVLATGLSSSKPADLPQPTHPSDPRISQDAFPKVGQSGATEQDIQFLYKGALKYLDSGKCSHVEYGDKSTSNDANTYFINCGGSNIFFTAADVQ